MKIVILDAYTENPGDLSWDAFKEFGDLTVYDRTSYVESDLIAERIGDAEIAVINKTPVSSRTIDACPNLKLIAVLATGLMSSTAITRRRRGFLWPTFRLTGHRSSRSMQSACFWRSVHTMSITVMRCTKADGRTTLTGASGIIR